MMTTDDLFRLALLVMFAASLFVAGYYRRGAASSGEKISWRDEGLGMFFALRLSGAIWFLATLLYLIAPGWMRWASLPLDHRLRWMGCAVGFLAILLMACALHSLGRNLTDTVATRADHSLITTGPYRWVRHPYYVATLLFVVASTLITANGFIGAVGVIVFTLLAARTPREEQKLVDRFGDDYRAYMSRTGRFLPWL